MTEITADPRAFLVAVVNSADPGVSIRERLDALKLLEDLGGLPHPACECWGPEAAEASDEEIDAMTDLLLADIVNALSGDDFTSHEWATSTLASTQLRRSGVM